MMRDRDVAKGYKTPTLAGTQDACLVIGHVIADLVRDERVLLGCREERACLEAAAVRRAKAQTWAKSPCYTRMEGWMSWKNIAGFGMRLTYHIARMWGNGEFDA